MKTHTIPQLKQLAKAQDYKLAALENINGERIVAFNQLKIKVDKHLDTIAQRLKADVHPDGVYNILFSHSINKCKTPDRYTITKGKVKPEDIADAARHIPVTPAVQIIERTPQVLSWDSALAFQQTIADLRAEITQLKFENNNLQAQIEQMEAEADEQPELSEPANGGAMGFFKEIAPQLIPLADRFFSLEEKKIDLEAQRIAKGIKTAPAAKKRPIQTIVPGSGEHLSLIQQLFDSEQDDKLNAELDRLQQANSVLYTQVLAQLGMTDEEQEQEGGSGE